MLLSSLFEVRFGRVVLHLRDDVRDFPSGPNKFVVKGVKVDLFISFNQRTLFGQRGPLHPRPQQSKANLCWHVGHLRQINTATVIWSNLLLSSRAAFATERVAWNRMFASAR